MKDTYPVKWKIEQALEILMAKENHFWCIKCCEWKKNIEKKIPRIVANPKYTKRYAKKITRKQFIKEIRPSSL